MGIPIFIMGGTDGRPRRPGSPRAQGIEIRNRAREEETVQQKVASIQLVNPDTFGAQYCDLPAFKREARGNE